MTNVARLLRLDRNLRDIGVREAAKRIGISAATLSRIERGHAMDAVTLMRIFNWLLAEHKET